jgi:hypothetical protein
MTLSTLKFMNQDKDLCQKTLAPLQNQVTEKMNLLLSMNQGAEALRFAKKAADIAVAAASISTFPPAIALALEVQKGVETAIKIYTTAQNVYLTHLKYLLLTSVPKVIYELSNAPMPIKSFYSGFSSRSFIPQFPILALRKKDSLKPFIFELNQNPRANEKQALFVKWTVSGSLKPFLHQLFQLPNLKIVNSCGFTFKKTSTEPIRVETIFYDKKNFLLSF